MRRIQAAMAAGATLVALVAATIVAWHAQLAVAAPISSLEGVVVSIYSGDQFILVNSLDNKRYKVRLIGADAPERGQPFFEEARDVLSEKIVARTVKVDNLRGELIKGYEGKVVCNGEIINNTMIKEGWAWYAPHMLPKSSDTLARHQAKAQEEKLGLWALKDQIEPWKFAENQPVAVARRLGRKKKDPESALDGLANSGEEGLASNDRPPSMPKPNKRDKEVSQDDWVAYIKLLKDWQGRVIGWVKAVNGWNNDQEFLEELKKADFGPEYSKKFWEVAEKHPKTTMGLHALWMTINNGNLGVPDMTTLGKAKDMLLADYIDREEMGGFLFNFLGVYPDEPLAMVRDIMRQVAEKSSKKDNQGCACYVLAISLWDDGVAPDVEQEALDLLDRVEQEFAKVDVGVFTLGEAAKENAYFIRNLSIGKVAPDIQGVDLDGQEMKLSDHRGKIVALEFWADSYPACRQNYPKQRELSKKFAGRPFVMLGVNTDRSKSRLKEAREREGIDWPNWADGAGGDIADSYMVENFPTVYVLDEQGIIHGRFRGTRGSSNAITGLVEGLLGPLEKGNGNTPSVSTQPVANLSEAIKQAIAEIENPSEAAP